MTARSAPAVRRTPAPAPAPVLTRAPRPDRDGLPSDATYEDDPMYSETDQGVGTGPTTQTGTNPPNACPDDIRLVDVIAPPLTATDVAAGMRTGRGGVAKLEVSDASGRNWNGTRIHENLTSHVNTCEPGRSACPNTSGSGGAAGSTFTVGRGYHGHGWTLPAEQNRFYDFHDTSRGTSFLHDHNLMSCERFCTQHYECGGRQFGPEFELTRLFTRDRITGPSGPVDVTRVELLEWENRPPPVGDFPERILPPGMEGV